jgi:hypothetical protein
MTELVRTGRLRAADPEMLAIEFFAPLRSWRQLYEGMPSLPLLADPNGFVKRHVDSLLAGAGTLSRAWAERDPAPRSFGLS